MIESTRIKTDTLSTNFMLTPRSLANVPALGEADAFRAITLLPGVVIANDLKGELHVRGGGADENLIILDGIEIQNPFHLLGLFGTFNVEALQQIQFYPGMTPVQYGDRLSSAIILHSKPAQEVARSKANISLLASSALLQKKWKHGGMMAAVRRTYLDLLTQVLGKKLGYYFYDGNFHLTQTLTPSWKMTVAGFFNIDHVNPEQTDGDNANQDVDYGWGNRAAAISFTHSTKEIFWQNQISLAKNYIYFAGADAELHIDNKVGDFSWRSQIEWHHASGTAIAGVFGKHLEFDYAWSSEENDEDLEEIFYKNVPYAFYDTRRQFIYGGFVEFSQKINSLLTARPGARVSATRFNNANLLPRVSMQLELPRIGSLRVNYGKNVQWQAFGREGIEGAIGSPLFPLDQVLRATIWSISLEKRIAEHFSISAEAYHKKFLAVSRLGEGNYPAFEFGTGKARGLDIFILRERGRLTFQAGYSWGESIYRFGEEIYPTDWDIRHSFKSLLGWHLNSNWSLHIVTQAQNGAPYTPAAGFAPIIDTFNKGAWNLSWVPVPGQRNSARLPKYLRADISLRKRWSRPNGNTELYFQILNLLFRRNTIRYTPQTRSFPTASGLQPRLYLESTTGLPLIPSVGIAFEF